MNKLKTFGLIAIITVAGVFLATSIYLDSIVKNSIQEYGPEILKVSVSVDNVSLSPWTGSGTIEGLIIENPDGFESDYLINIGRLSLDIDVTTLLSDHIIIEDFLLQEMHVIYERSSGTTNIAALEKLMAQETSSEANAQNITINHMVVENSRVTLQASLLAGKSIDVKIPRMEREQISSQDNSLGATIKIILETVLHSVKNAGAKAIQKSGDLKVKDKLKGMFKNK